MLDWVEFALPAARATLDDPAQKQWTRYQGTWFAGVNALENDAQGAVTWFRIRDNVGLPSGRDFFKDGFDFAGCFVANRILRKFLQIPPWVYFELSFDSSPFRTLIRPPVCLSFSASR